jgi:hypothetical protein
VWADGLFRIRETALHFVFFFSPPNPPLMLRVREQWEPLKDIRLEMLDLCIMMFSEWINQRILQNKIIKKINETMVKCLLSQFTGPL